MQVLLERHRMARSQSISSILQHIVTAIRWCRGSFGHSLNDQSRSGEARLSSLYHYRFFLGLFVDKKVTENNLQTLIIFFVYS